VQEVGGACLGDAFQKMRLDREPRDRFHTATVRRLADQASAGNGAGTSSLHAGHHGCAVPEPQRLVA